MDPRLIKTVLYHWANEAINTYMKTYKNITPGGLNFHLSLIDGVCCMIVYDRYFCEYQIQYFTNINKALRFINNLWLVVIVGLEPTIGCVWSNCISHYAILPYRNTLPPIATEIYPSYCWETNVFLDGALRKNQTSDYTIPKCQYFIYL